MAENVQFQVYFKQPILTVLILNEGKDVTKLKINAIGMFSKKTDEHLLNTEYVLQASNDKQILKTQNRALP